ncbi:MAG TPA: trehalose-phosphatase, partial [Gaiellaceae bacterium]|nr:trehalose-phosphatase [Gaiellaceae bacterium]
ACLFWTSVDTANLIARLAERPETSAALLDVDGTLAPIVDRPEDAGVPEETRSLLRDLAGRYALVACVSGRTEADARRVVGVEELVYVGEHGVGFDPHADEWQEELDRLVGESDWEPEPERKGFSAAFHYRTADDQAGAIAALRTVERRAVELGLRPRWGRKVLEVLAPVAANKGTAVRTLLGERGIRRALYAGDDATDLEAFRGLDGLDLAVRVAVVSDEGPNELGEAADVIVGGTQELTELLRSL